MRILWIIPFLLLLGGCTTKTYDQKYSSHITIRTDGLRYSDMGFMYQNSREIKAEIYSFATPVFTLTMHSNICIEKACYRYEVFNRRYLHSSYPRYLIRNVFKGTPIFDSHNVKVTKDGFTQHLEAREYDIIYSVTDQLIRFHDRKNNILIQIRQLQGEI